MCRRTESSDWGPNRSAHFLLLFLILLFLFWATLVTTCTKKTSLALSFRFFSSFALPPGQGNTQNQRVRETERETETEREAGAGPKSEPLGMKLMESPGSCLEPTSSAERHSAQRTVEALICCVKRRLWPRPPRALRCRRSLRHPGVSSDWRLPQLSGEVRGRPHSGSLPPEALLEKGHSPKGLSHETFKLILEASNLRG